MGSLLALQLILSTVDWHQTREIAAHPCAYYETNGLMGRHPDAGMVNRHFIETEALVLGSAYLLPEYRTTILGASAAVEAGFVAHNYHIGLKVSF